MVAADTEDSDFVSSFHTIDSPDYLFDRSGPSIILKQVGISEYRFLDIRK
jgi:hypothetical protein